MHKKVRFSFTLFVCWGKWRITKYQIERIQIYTDCKISVSLFGSSEMLLSHGKTSFCGGADEFFEYIFPASRCYGGAHLDSGHPPPWFCLKIFRKTIFLQGHQHHKNNLIKCIITVMFFFKMSIKIYSVENHLSKEKFKLVCDISCLQDTKLIFTAFQLSGRQDKPLGRKTVQFLSYNLQMAMATKILKLYHC